MNTPLIIMSVIVILVVYGVVLNNLRTSKWDFLSWRNVFLLGFAQFYGFGTYYTIVDNFGSDIYVASEKGKFYLFVALPTFIFIFFIAMKIGEKRGGFIRRVIPSVQLPITDLGLLITIAALLGAAIFAAAVPMGSYLTVLISQFKGGLAGGAAALATYYLIARRFNPIAWTVFAATFCACLLVSMVGEVGRRGILSVLMGIGWMGWYYALKRQSLAAKVVKLGSVAVVTFVMIAFYASIRGEGGTTSTGGGGFTLSMRAKQITQFLQNPTMQKGAITTMMASDAPTDTMFIMENYPRSYPYDPFNGLVYFFVNPVPRFLWQDKPLGMGVVVQKQLGTPANLGIGIIGHGWSEGGWFGIAGYAIFFGLLMGAMDRLIRDRSWNPFFVSAVGSNLGNVFGLARGETSLFLVLVVTSIIGVVTIMTIVKMIFGPLMASGAPLLTAGNRWILDPPPDQAVLDEHGVEVEPEHAESYDPAMQAYYERTAARRAGYADWRETHRIKEAG